MKDVMDSSKSEMYDHHTTIPSQWIYYSQLEFATSRFKRSKFSRSRVNMEIVPGRHDVRSEIGVQYIP